MIIYMVRHAQTEANKEGVIQGQKNTDITPDGLINAKRAATYFKDKKITRIFSSPIKRALITAKLIADESKYPYESIFLENGIKEIDLSPWEFKKIADLDQSDAPCSYYTYKHSPSHFIPQGGESIFDVRQRTSMAYKQIVESSSPDDRIVIVSHSMAIRTLITYIEDKTIDSVWEYNIPSVSITEVHYEKGISSVISIGKVIE